MKGRKGFSLLELLVIFGIIVIIATIILVNLTQSRGKASDTAIVKNLNDLQTYSQLYYLEHQGNFEAFCADSQSRIFLTNAGQDISKSCVNSAQSWCAYAELKANPNMVYCVDSGIKKGKFNEDEVSQICSGSSSFSCP